VIGEININFEGALSYNFASGINMYLGNYLSNIT